MRIRLLSISQKSPAWVDVGFKEYLKRLPHMCSMELIEIPAQKRGAYINRKRLLEREGERILAAIKPNHRVIALDSTGQFFTSPGLAQQVAKWMQDGRNIDLIIGGADGIAPNVLQRIEEKWSLSPLTFPHHVVRILVAEQIYRACSILDKHPYHR